MNPNTPEIKKLSAELNALEQDRLDALKRAREARADAERLLLQQEEKRRELIDTFAALGPVALDIIHALDEGEYNRIKLSGTISCHIVDGGPI